MKLGMMNIGKQVLNGGEEIYVPYTKDEMGDIIPYEPHNTVKEAMKWIFDQCELLPLKVLDKVRRRMEDPKMKREALEYIIASGLISDKLSRVLLALDNKDKQGILEYKIYPYRINVVATGEYHKKVCGIFGDSIEPNGINSEYVYTIIEGMHKGYRLKAHQQQIGNQLHHSIYEVMSWDLCSSAVTEFFVQHHQIG